MLPLEWTLTPATAAPQRNDTPASSGTLAGAADRMRLAGTGIPALDSRLGGLVRGRHYLLDGLPGSGKSSAALQFIGHGLAMGEKCLILTQDDPADLIAQAEYLGFDFRTAAEQERLAVLQYRLDFARNYARAADPAKALAELREHVAEHQPSRFVIDAISPFLEGGRASEDALAAFPAFLESLHCTTYLTVPGDLSDVHFGRIYDRITAGAAGIFQFAHAEGQVRTLTIRKLRQPVRSTEPLHFVLRAGSGIVEYEAPRHEDTLPEEIRRRVVLLRCSSSLPEELSVALERAYHVVRFDSVEDALGELVGGRHGALIIALEPRDSERVFSLTRELRRAGNGAPILFVSPSQGLRGSTRARGLRAGGDDFLTDALSPEELLERIEVARARGHRRPQVEGDLEPLFLQPVDADGRYELLAHEPFCNVLREKLAQGGHPFFALAVIRPDGMSVADAWEVLSRSLRVKEGDLGCVVDGQRIVVYLHDVRRRHVEQLLRRITAAHPALGVAEEVEVFCYPTDRDEVDAWLRPTTADEPICR